LEIEGIGIDLNDSRINGDLNVLNRELEFFKYCGFTAVELTTSGLFFILNGRLNKYRTEKISRILEKYAFKYTLHVPDNLNLAVSENSEKEYKIFSSCIDFADIVKAEVIVYHCGLNLLNTDFGKDSFDELQVFQEREIGTLKRLTAYAYRKNIIIAVENTDPIDFETEIIEKRGIGEKEIKSFHPSLYPEAIVSEIKKINMPNIGMTLDLGHLFLSTSLTGEDFLKTVEEVAPYVVHIHLNDNFGINKEFEQPKIDEPLYGVGDCHLPPGYGKIPIKEALEYLHNFKGHIILELKPQYRDDFAEALVRVNKLIDSISRRY